jgi:hypothetical protein
MKAANIILLLIAIATLWTTEAKTEDKIFLTIFFTIAIGFWLMTLHYDKERVA